MRFKIDWASLIVWSKYIVFALFYFVFEGSFLSSSHRGAYIWRGDLTEGFCGTGLGGLYLERAYTWKGLFSEFYGIWLEDRRHRRDQKQERKRIKKFLLLNTCSLSEYNKELFI